jgi:uncharacterized protein YndB with AHSA1/START domain
VTGSAQSPKKIISKRVWIRASPNVVYKALTEAPELVHWFCDHASCDPREGGDLEARWRTGKTTQRGRARITHLNPGASLELLWLDDVSGTPDAISHHTLSYEIQSKSGMTELIMIDKDISAPDEETYAFLDQGWNSVLIELRDYCERKERTANLQPRPKTNRSKAPAE